MAGRICLVSVWTRRGLGCYALCIPPTPEYSMRRCVIALILMLVSLIAPTNAQSQRGAPPDSQRGPAVPPPRFQYVGPAAGGRISAVAGIPGDTTTYYMGAASGGIWKTTDGARTFTPVFDDQPVQAIGALAVAPSNPRTVWAGTGEGWAIRDADVMGDGVYKSIDAGATWTNMGLKEVGRIGKIIVHPTNANMVFVCALGRATGPQQERGVYRTRDGGTTWDRVLFVNENTGCSGIAIDASDPKVLFAGTWEVVMHTWAMFGGGAGSGVYVSRDSGSTWSRILDEGLPRSPVGKIDVAVAPSNSKRVYALIQTPDQGSLWRSDDGGEKWKVVSWDRALIGRAGYYIRVAVNPENDLEVLVTNSSFHRSLDGGLTFPLVGGGCGDCHDIWMDPRNPAHWVVTGDAGAGITRNHGQSFTQFALPIGQMYHVAVDDQMPYWIYGNRQDASTSRGPNNQPAQIANVVLPGAVAVAGGRGGQGAGGGGGFGGGGGANGAWTQTLGGCESGFTLPTPGNPDIVWATCYGNKVTRYDAKSNQARSVSPWRHTLDSEPDKLKYRCHWTAPLAIDPFDPNTVYYGCQVIFKTSNAGQDWKVISPDLSTNDTSRIVSSGGIIGDNLGQFYGEVVFAIAPSEIRKGMIWAGTNDGKLWLTTDGGGKWSDLTKNVSGMPTWGTVRKIEPSRFDAATAYVVVDMHMMDDRKPYIYKTSDMGKSWSRISDGLPQDHPLSYAMSIAENPNRKGMLFAGTGNALYHSMNDGATWTAVKAGLPASPVTWIVIPKLTHDVVVSTYGRGLYVLRDITMMEQADKVVADAPVFLYEPRDGVRLARNGSADFTYSLKSAPKDTLTFDILDAAGTVVRSVKTVARAGVNRLTWDLRYDGPKQVELRTTPPDNPRIWDEPRFRKTATRPINHWGIQGPQRIGPLASPGQYSVRLKLDSVPYTKSFRVIKDAKIASTEADLLLSTAAQTRVRDALTSTSDIVNRLEIMRKQIEDHRKSDIADAAAKAALAELDEKMLKVELQLVSKTDLHSDDKWFVEQYKVYLNLIWLAGEIGTGAGDVAGGADFRPTTATLTTLGELERDLSQAKRDFASLMEKDLKAFNTAMNGRLPAITDKLPDKRLPLIIP